MSIKNNGLGSKKAFIGLTMGVVALVILTLYIGGSAIAGADPSAGGAPPPMPVKVQTVLESDAPIWSEYAGRLDAVDYVQVMPQVGGAIKAIKFQDGQNVKKGDVLFVIDPAPYEAATAQANADVATAKSQHDLAQKELVRAQGLLKTDAISKTLLDQRASAASVAKNVIDAATARLRQAKIDLDYAYVKAPIAGRVSRAEITEGNIVQPGPNAPVLTTIVANEAIYADFDVDEQTYIKHIRGMATQGIEAERAIPVMLSIKGDTSKTYEGTVHSFDNRINPETGTIRARALFKNDDGALLPGMFATVKLGGPGGEKKIMLPERAVGTDQDRKFVFVVNPENKVEYRQVHLGATMDGMRVVEDGVKAGERVVMEGLMRIRPDMVVDPQEETQAAPAGAAPLTEEPPPVEGAIDATESEPAKKLIEE